MSMNAIASCTTAWLSILVSFRKAGIVSAQTSGNSACPYGNAIYGASIIYGRNEGGCYQCDDDATGTALSGTDLVAACQRLCDDDPLCKSFEVGHPALAPFYEGLNGAVTNCCLEYDVVAPDHPLYIDGRDAALEGTDCAKQAACWNSYVRSEFLSENNVNCDQNKPVIPAATAGTGQLKGTPTGIAGSLGRPKCRQVTWPDASLAGAELLQMVAKRKKWLAEGCPIGSISLGHLLDDAYNACLETMESEEAQNRLDSPADDATPSDEEPTPSDEESTARPTDIPSPAPTAKPTDDVEDSSSATAQSHHVRFSFSILAVAAYVIFS